MSGIGIFDLPAIRQSCWQTCAGDPGAFPIDLGEVPEYRHDDSRESFYEVAAFFGCVDICDDDYKVKRILFVTPIAAAVTALLLLVVTCWFCRACPLYRMRKQREKHRLMATSASLDLPLPATGVTNDGFIEEGDFEEEEEEEAPPPSYKSAVLEKGKKRSGTGLAKDSSRVSTISGSKSDSNLNTLARRSTSNSKTKKSNFMTANKDVDLSASLRSNVSVNSWVNEPEDERSRRIRKDSFMATASKLSRRLVDMDRTASLEVERRRRGGPRNRAQMMAGVKPKVDTGRSRSRSQDTRNSSNSSNSNRSTRRVSSQINNPPMRF